MTDIFADEEESYIPEVAEAADVPETASEGAARDEKGRFAAKTGVESQETADTVPPTEQRELPKEEFAGLKDERRKRQEAEERERIKDARIAALEAQFNTIQNPPAPAPSVWEDEQGFAGHIQSNAVSQAVQQATYNARLDMSEMMVRQANPDFEAVKAEFLSLAQQNPSIVQQALQDPHPWNKAYEIAKNHQAMQELGAVNVADMEAKLRAKIMAEMQAQPAPAANLPQSLADVQSSRGNVAPGNAYSLADIIGR